MGSIPEGARRSWSSGLYAAGVSASRRTSTYGALVLVILAAVIATGCRATRPSASVASASSTNPFRTGRTLVIPHNGGDGDYPADTLVALENSMAAGGEVVDIDVSLTADGQLVAFHDATVDAITGGHGEVANMTFGELEQLDAGWGFAAADGSHPFRGKGVRVPLVRDLLDRFPNAFVSLDLKDLGTDIVRPVCKLLHQTGRLAKTFVGSDGDAQIIEMRRQCPDVHTTYNMVDVRATRAAETANDATFIPPAFVDQPPYRIGNSGTPIVTPASVAFAHAHNLAIMTWVIDDEPTMKLLVNMGVDGIYTRKPALLAKVVKQHNQSSP